MAQNALVYKICQIQPILRYQNGHRLSLGYFNEIKGWEYNFKPGLNFNDIKYKIYTATGDRVKVRREKTWNEMKTYILCEKLRIVDILGLRFSREIFLARSGDFKRIFPTFENQTS